MINPIDEASFPIEYVGYYDNQSRPMRGVAPVEARVILYVNGRPLVNLMCTPTRLEALAVGFLYNEGLIEGIDEVAEVRPCGDGRSLDVWLKHAISLPDRRVITTGCAGGATFEDIANAHHPIKSDLRVTPRQVTGLLNALAESSRIYRRTGGIHAAALGDGERLVCVAEDVGRHNALDKVAGACLRHGQPTRDGILLTSGRISSEMVSKAARMGAPIVISRTSPTSLSVQLAREWGVTLIGYIRRRSFRVYAGEERVTPD